MSNTAVFLDPARSLAEGTERAALAEKLGYHSVWLTQTAGREATIVAAAYAQATSSIGIGIGVLPIYPRTPVVMAQTAATLAELSEGRFILGLGPSHKLTIEGWHDMHLDRPLPRMREYVAAVRSILQGSTYSGELYRTAFSFMGYEPPANTPIYVSCLSPKMCRLAGEIADGAVLWMCAPGYIANVVVPQIKAGREAVGKTMEGFEIVAAVPVSITDDVQAGRDAFRRVAMVYWNLPFYRAAIAGAGLEADLREFDQKGPTGVSDQAIEAFAGIGGADEAKKAVEAYRKAGVTLPGVAPLPRHEGAKGVDETLEVLA